jgi:carbamoyl-phosphate synthase large subunit
MTMVNVAFSSAGRRVELLKAFRDAYRNLGLTGNIIALDVDPLAPALQVADRAYIVPRLQEASFVPALIEICVRDKVQLIFPLTDRDIPILASRREEIERTDAKVVVVSSEAAQMTADKWLTIQFFQRLGLPTPQSWIPSGLDPERASYPLFIKPRMGSAGKGTYKVESRHELAFFTEYVSDPIVQEYLSGPEVTSDVICDLDGDLLGVVCRQRIEVRWGEVAKGVTIHNSEIIEGCARIARELPSVGPITVQCFLEKGRPRFTEINARFAGGVPLGIRAGLDAPRLLLARAAHLPVQIPPLGSYSVGLYMTRFDDSLFLTESDRARMASRCL